MLRNAVLLTKWDLGYEYELLRNRKPNETMVTRIAFERLENNEENLRAAEEELDLNTLGKTEAEMVGERKTLARLKIELRDRSPSIWATPEWKENIFAEVRAMWPGAGKGSEITE